MGDEIRGLIFDIQRYSTHDGPGIRTTAFLKGCPLRCPWCHNPESISRQPELLFWRSRCIGCLGCAAACPHGAIKARTAEGQQSPVPVIDRASCAAACRNTGCEARTPACVAACPTGALESAGRWIEPAELTRELLRDRAFYGNSGGGVTFSGGEALLQPAFLLETLKLCKAAGLHTAVDTSGEVPWEDIQSVLPYTDLFLYDIKPASSERVFDNLRRLGAEIKEAATNSPAAEPVTVPVIPVSAPTAQTASAAASAAASAVRAAAPAVQIRIPVIPGRNDTPEAILAVSEAVRGHSVCLLPFHRLGSGKYEALGIEYPAGNLTPPDAATMAALADALRGVAREVMVG